MRTIEIPESIELNIGKTGKTIALDCLATPESILVALLKHGAQQRVTDCNAGAKGHEPTMLANAEDEIMALETGEARFGSGGGGARLTDVERECRLIVANALVKKGWSRVDADKAAIKWRNVVTDETAQAAVIARAETTIAARGPAIELDL